MKDGKEIMLHFYEKNVDNFLNIILNTISVHKDAYSNYTKGDEPFKWIDKYVSNYEYLQWLNEIAGRSYTDITQYPVLPWSFVTKYEKIEED